MMRKEVISVRVQNEKNLSTDLCVCVAKNFNLFMNEFILMYLCVFHSSSSLAHTRALAAMYFIVLCRFGCPPHVPPP